MVKARGPIWHKKQKQLGIMPKKLRGVDRQATWGKSRADGWVYGHGSFTITPHTMPVIGLFQWMPNSGHEAKRLERELQAYPELITTVCMDAKADDQPLYARLQQRGMQLLTVPRKGMDKSLKRQAMIAELATSEHRRTYKARSTTVEPAQGLVKELFDLDTCWMRGDTNNRWLFAAMGVSVQMAQWQAYQAGESIWQIRERVIGT